MENKITLNKNDIYREALAAHNRIKDYIRETPLEYDGYLSQLTQCKVYLKLENFQVTGSFKSRGAFNKLLSLHHNSNSIITASTGNHGTALAYAAQKLGKSVDVVVPQNTTPTKLNWLHRYGANIINFGKDVVETEDFARQLASKQDKIYVSPYNDIHIIGGQATVAIELLNQINKVDAVFAPVGGGGLMSGMAGYMKSMNNHIQMMGCQPQNSPVMMKSIKAGKIIQMESKPTWADGSAGGIEKNSCTFPLCRDYVDRFIMVSEDEIKNAIMLVLEQLNMLIEGAAALSVAAFLKEKEKYKKQTVALILTGRKISLEKLKEILS